MATSPVRFLTGQMDRWHRKQSPTDSDSWEVTHAAEVHRVLPEGQRRTPIHTHREARAHADSTTFTYNFPY